MAPFNHAHSVAQFAPVVKDFLSERFFGKSLDREAEVRYLIYMRKGTDQMQTLINVHADELGDTYCVECDTIIDTDRYDETVLSNPDEFVFCPYHEAEAAAEEWADSRRQW